ncbi:uncharacterized protein A4U43_C05F35450 [Asparagus officinalis]|uniref:Plastid lipid-associated protein/fibrillin conserved domain-containing protein n=1 Tax=Asparagus officinalis TaxID=4686 RepID=A0A5P1F1N1_ASPOF|nr:uncharacterized protein A4U43_C05F35450 [Asparagus officinalis]
MVQVVEAPDAIRNRVSFSVFGFLNGKLKALDDKWIQVIFEPPQLKIGSLGFQYGGESEVKLQITYIDEKIRLGKGSRESDSSAQKTFLVVVVEERWIIYPVVLLQPFSPLWSSIAFIERIWAPIYGDNFLSGNAVLVNFLNTASLTLRLNSLRVVLVND